MDIVELINYIDARISSEDHGESFWVNDLGQRISSDTGYGAEWWEYCMKPELLRKFGGETK